MKEITIKFLKNCCTTEKQFKKGEEIQIKMIDSSRPEDGNLKGLFNENGSEKYFEILTKKTNKQ